MSGEHEEPGLGDRVEERPHLDFSPIRKTPPRELLIRFVAGAGTSIGAGLITLAFGSRVGGIFLAFPAILAASLTLIASRQGPSDAREDARGAHVGGAAMIVYAVVVALAIGHLASAVVLVIATLAWLLFAVSVYAVLWLR
ncbi:MAG: DUF3147 family protein [Solirubrobacterales bacterium]|nr:DUF3147 family protein [Solirubrobacterales bacterium]